MTASSPGDSSDLSAPGQAKQPSQPPADAASNGSSNGDGNGRRRLSPAKRSTRLRRTAARIKARIRHSAMTSAPLWLSRGQLALPTPERMPVTIQRQVILPDLPEPIDGLRITHLSDLHIGRLTTPDHLPGIIDICMSLDSDLIAITGDFIDLSTKYIDDVVAALGKLEAPLGVFLVPGNHDYLENGPKLVRKFRNAKLNLLMNKAVRLEYENHAINIAGVDYGHQRAKRCAFVRDTLKSCNKDGKADLNILLAHHPDAFDEACRHDVHLTLSGHTHGGQLILKHTQGKRGSIGLGAMAFKYPRGLYQRGSQHLHVTSGVGSWFPLRVQCPSEIVQLTLSSTGG